MGGYGGVNIRGLQWGHGLAAVETGGVVVDEVLAVGLQWGHGLAAVETV